MEKWVEIKRSGDINALAKLYGISPILAKIIRNRDMLEPGEIRNFLNPGAEHLNDPMMLKGMKRVISVLRDKITDGRNIRIIGDYDVDGICATYIFFKGLSFFGANVDYVIPHRIEDGYGINQKLIQATYDEGRDTIVTCDNGIAAISETEYANSLGLTMLITDHHEIPYVMIGGEKEYKLPDADGIVDPKLPGDDYSFKGICGAYVAFQTIKAYATEYGYAGRDDFNKLLSELIEFAALATVCDVMELRDENRSLVCEGMRRMQHSSNLGLSTLIKVTGLEDKILTPYHLGFVIGPCMNASGRLDTSLKAMELFVEDDPQRALEKAEILKNLNEERKQMTVTQTQNAFLLVDEKEKPDDVIVVYLPECHESLAGIIAGKVRERYNHPAFVVTKTKEGLKGSGRSIDAYDMFESLNAVKDYLGKFGGHKLAAGISLSEENLDAFRIALNEKSNLTSEDFCSLVRIDMVLDFEYASLSLAKELAKLEPYGNGNEKPLFALQNVRFLSGTKLGKTGRAAKYKVASPKGYVTELLYFGDLDLMEQQIAQIYGEEKAKLLHTGSKVDILLDICYQIDINTFRGVDSTQLLLKHFR